MIFVKNNGVVGIGTDDPQEALDVVEDINATVDIHVGNCIVFASGGRFAMLKMEKEYNLIGDTAQCTPNCRILGQKNEITIVCCDERKDSSRVEFCNRLIRDYVYKNSIRYLNVSVYNCECARVAEWLMHSFDTRCPSGLMGSNPIPGVFSFSYDLNTVDVHVGNWGFPSGQFCIHQGGARTLSGPQNTECEGKGRFAMLRSKRGREIKMMKCKYLYSILDSILLRSILNEI